MKKILIIALLVSIVWGGFIADELAEKIKQVPADEPINVIVWLTEPPGWKADFDRICIIENREQKRYETVKSLEYHHHLWADPVRQWIEREFGNKAKLGDNLYGAFSFVLSAPAEVIKQVVLHPRVRTIFLNLQRPKRFCIPYNINNPFERAIFSNPHIEPPDALSSPTDVYTWQLDIINAPEAWAMGYNGSGVVVAILDTGIDSDHPALASHIWTNSDEIAGNSIDDDGNGYVDDVHGYDFYNHDANPEDDPSSVHHGTMCAGMVVGTGYYRTGSAPGAVVMPIRIGNGSSFVGDADEVNAFYYALNNGADVVSISYGTAGGVASVKAWYRYYYTNIFFPAGIPVIVAAGNGNDSGGHYSLPNDIMTPGDVPTAWYSSATSNPDGPVITVGATTDADAYATWASHGPTSWYLTSYGYTDYPYPPGLMKPDVAAPGENVVVTTWGGSYSYSDGTSFSTPLTAGVVALMLCKNGGLTLRQIDSLIEKSAKDITPTGRDNNTGAGRVAADSVLKLVPGITLVMDSVIFYDIAPGGNNDKKLDPGEQSQIRIWVRNAASQTANSVNVTINSVTNSNVTVSDNSSNYGNITPGSSVVNSSDPIVFNISSSAMPGEYCKAYLTMSASGYSRPDSFAFRIGAYPRQLAYHDTGAVILGISNFAYITDMAFPWPTDSTDNLYAGYLMLGNNSSYIADAIDIWPLTKLEIVPGVIANQESFTRCFDTLNRFEIHQSTYQWKDAPNNDFVIFHYVIFNKSGATLNNLLFGFWADFDVPSYDSNYAYWVDANDWGYMYSARTGQTKRFGLVALSPNCVRGSVIDNPTYVYQEGAGWTDAIKWNFLSGTTSQSSGTSLKDWSIILVFGPANLAPNQKCTLAVAVVAGSNQSDFEANANAAREIYSSYPLMVGEKEQTPPNLLFSASPNPFNSSCKISFALNSNISQVNVEILDISGRVVKNFGEIEAYNTTRFSLIWDGKDNNNRELPSGTYFAIFRCSNTRITKPIVLLR